MKVVSRQNELLLLSSRSPVPLQFSFCKNVRVSFSHIYTLVFQNSRAPNLPSIHLMVSLRPSVFQICNDFRYPGASHLEMRISSIDFNDSHLRGCIDVARRSRAMISNVSRACRVHGVQPESTGTRMVWRTPVSRPSACVAFGARRRWRPASLLGSPGPARSTPNTGIRGAWCTRVCRTSVCVAFGARVRAATPSGLLSCTVRAPSEPSSDHTQSSKHISFAQTAHHQDQPQSSTTQPTVNNNQRAAPVGYAP